MARAVGGRREDEGRHKAAGRRVREEWEVARGEAAGEKGQVAEDQALIAHRKLQMAKLKRERFGTSAERTSRLLDQLELQLEELEASATEDELAAEQAIAEPTPPGPDAVNDVYTDVATPHPWTRVEMPDPRPVRTRV